MAAGNTRLAVYGAAGRMGQAILRIALQHPGCDVTAALVRPGSGWEGQPFFALFPLEPAAAGGVFTANLEPEVGPQVMIDFSTPAGFEAALSLALERQIAFLSGTTGLDARQHAALQHAASRIPVLHATNFSLGAAMLEWLAGLAAAKLDADFEIEIIEAHHRHKRDAPSGTALTLGEAVARARGADLGQVARTARTGTDCARMPGEVGFSSIRAGDIVGEHTVLFAGLGERLELTHRADSRDIFARGAVRAALWLVGQAPGRYRVTDVFASPQAAGSGGQPIR